MQRCKGLGRIGGIFKKKPGEALRRADNEKY
jgi:hypothetical protein